MLIKCYLTIVISVSSSVHSRWRLLTTIDLGFIHAVYPESLIIHMVRDPLDTIFSCYRQKFDDNGLEWSLDIKDLVLQYVLYLEYVDHFRKLLPDRVLDVRYEDLVDDPEEILKDIVVNRLSLPWDPKVLDFHNSQRVVLTNSQSRKFAAIFNFLTNWY